ncbi:glutathione s-transferase protein [Pyrenophora tritici-repentis]|uniref:Gst, Glutathione S-transferase n=2 Tax=Pyrenophora tritici-repentis TaxID=45151 RepID=A0A2W1D6T9_9PLEO|nr:glutathione S-transferase II [Pyrenophora tritici-repentis Pt-1C-BFP]KAA8624585.1 glutathione s-transferase protein [Pyrenophora tritici-repentis]EDU39459.1 glutathione S-transferase II [Pyrenophora tritici-repentis Pt-1C-BFP]KAF7452983.1 glutathione s-transferase protein [Pyrenophora tritici-repentis]KAF7576030.1 Gst, Glutathione S-transferase [Pyrenophora tritici-repentis]KAI1541077.1 Gst Glutathione S-transferase [Pyrenophora tritici-repentis]
MSQNSDITLYTTQTPNGIKISITLEELGIPYKVQKIEISKNTQKEDWFLAINPNGRIPALTDTFTDGKQINLFESGSIMQYLVDRYDTEHKISFPRGSREWYEMNNWLFFQNAGVGPMQGQSNHFTRYAPEHIEYGINRYQNETRRLYSVLDKHLSSDNRPYLCGEKCTIADLSHYGWVAAAGWAGIDITEFPALMAWEERMTARPGVEKGRHVPDPHTIKETLKDKKKVEEIAASSRNWVQAGMKEDAAKLAK